METDNNKQTNTENSPAVETNCWLVKNLNHNPYKRCQYCQSKFHECAFLQYQAISLVLIVFSFILFYFIERRISEPMIISIFTLVIVYGYFFSKSTDKIIQANFVEKKAKKALEELSVRLEEKVDEQTKEIKKAYRKIAKAYEIEKRTHEELKRLNEVKNQFMLSTQHHLRSPLSVIQGYLSMVVEGSYGQINPEIAAKIQTTLSETKKMIKMVDDLLDMAKFHMNKGTVAKEPTDIEKTIAGIIEDLKQTAQDKNIYLKFDPAAKTVPYANVDSHGIREAIYNITDNAIKYTQEGGVTVSVSSKSKKIIISIADTGIGMNKEDLAGLFTRTFERGAKAKNVNINGKGIGLYLAAQMITNNNGTINAKSSGWGKGTEFIIELPTTPKTGKKTAAEPPAPTNTPLN